MSDKPISAILADLTRAQNKCDTLLAEIARLTRADTQWADYVVRLADERDMLRAEREVWANIAQERNDLRAEVDRLRQERDNAVEAEKIALRVIGAENERLRAALREVVTEGHREACKISVGRCNCSYSDAAAALGNVRQA